MTANLGKTDRILRFILGLVLVFAPLMNMPPIWSSGALAFASMGVGAVLMVTAFVRFCPVYRILGISTRKA